MICPPNLWAICIGRTHWSASPYHFANGNALPETEELFRLKQNFDFTSVPHNWWPLTTTNSRSAPRRGPAQPLPIKTEVNDAGSVCKCPTVLRAEVSNSNNEMSRLWQIQVHGTPHYEDVFQDIAQEMTPCRSGVEWNGWFSGTAKLFKPKPHYGCKTNPRVGMQISNTS